jgi:hypothetical protein
VGSEVSAVTVGVESESDRLGIVAEPDWRIWLPGLAPAGRDEQAVDLESWAQELTKRAWQASGREPDANGVPRLAGFLRAAGRRDHPSLLPWEIKWIHLPDPDDVPLVIVLGLFELEGPAEEVLRDMVGADDPDTVEPAVIEEFSGGLGEGFRGLSYRTEATAGGSVFATLAYSWRVESMGVDVRVWGTWTPQRVLAAMDDVDGLVRSLKVVG